MFGKESLQHKSTIRCCEILATSSRRFVLQTFIFFSLNLMSLDYSDTNQIWISGRYDGWNIPNICILSQLAPHCANFPWVAFSTVAVQDHLQKWTYHGPYPFSMIRRIIHHVVFNKVVHIIHPSLSMSFFRTPSNDWLWFSLGWYKEFQWSSYEK